MPNPLAAVLALVATCVFSLVCMRSKPGSFAMLGRGRAGACRVPTGTALGSTPRGKNGVSVRSQY